MDEEYSLRLEFSKILFCLVLVMRWIGKVSEP